MNIQKTLLSLVLTVSFALSVNAKEEQCKKCPCKPFVQKFCPELTPTKEEKPTKEHKQKIHECLMQHQVDLSKECQEKLSKKENKIKKQ